MEDAKGIQGCSGEKHLLLRQHQHQYSCENGGQGDERGNTRHPVRTLSLDRPGTQALKSSIEFGVPLSPVLSLPPFRGRHTRTGPTVSIAVCFDAIPPSSPPAPVHLWLFPICSARARALATASLHWRCLLLILPIIPPSSTMFKGQQGSLRKILFLRFGRS